MAEKRYNFRSLARIVIEAETPLSVGSGSKNVKTDAAVNRDMNDLPFIPGTTIAGLVRHAINDEARKKHLMGFQERNAGEGSRLIFTEAKMLDVDSKPIDGLLDKTQLSDDTRSFLKHFEQLPIRQHAKISHRGTAADKGKFDEEVVYKGTRFCFEMELLSEENSEEDLLEVLKTLYATDFRIGGGSRSGFGKISVISAAYKTLDLSQAADMQKYLGKPSSLNEQWSDYVPFEFEDSNADAWVHYQLVLQPQDFLFFSSGFGSDKADKTIVKERFIQWNNEGHAEFVDSEKTLLIPASSVKGAISHRTAFHYNKLSGVFADEKDNLEEYVGKNNKAVLALFGSEGDERGNNKKRGHILIADILQERNQTDKEKVMNHVKIDRFTGGAIDGALFSEEVLYAKQEEITIDILVNNAAFAGEKGEDIKNAFEQALKDICNGMLPLGGSVNRGNGIFKGTWTKDGEEQA